MQLSSVVSSRFQWRVYFARLPLFSRDILLNCIRRFWKSIPPGCRTKADCINLIRSDFAQQTKELIQSSTPDLLRLASPHVDSSMPRLLLICRFIHNRYGAVIASQLLCTQTRWNPPEETEDGISQPAWLRTPVTQIRSRLTKVNVGTSDRQTANFRYQPH